MVIVSFNYLYQGNCHEHTMAYKLLLPIATRKQFPSQPNQPTNITFPKECSLENFAHFNNLGLPATWHWLHYDPSNNAAFCHTCITGLVRHKMKATSVEPAFVSTYYIIIGYRVKI